MLLSTGRQFALGCALIATLSGAAVHAAGGSAPDAVGSGRPQAGARQYVLGPGDDIKISVFQNPDLSVETRVSEDGTITFPLIGSVTVGGSSTEAAEKRIAKLLKDGKFLVDPQVTIYVQQVHGNQVAALGQFNRPGRYPLETTQVRLSDLISLAGGIAPSGSDTVIFVGTREGKPVWKAIDVGSMFVNNQLENDLILQDGDELYVDRFPVFFIYGEVQRPGSYRVERNMSFVQALAAGGGLTPRGTRRGLRVRRKDASGHIEEMTPELDDPVKPEDVVYVREGVF
jgi:polysaccharide export outer membrane protein